MDSLPLPFLPMLFFLHIGLFPLNSVSSSSVSESYYKDHCKSFVPESTPTNFGLYPIPLKQYQHGYYISGGDRILHGESSRYSVSLYTRRMYGTDVSGLFKVEGRLTIRCPIVYVSDSTYFNHAYSPGYTRTRHSQWRSVSFHLDGFWSASLGKLCMVGTGVSYSREGNMLYLNAVLRLYNMANSSDITSLISGNLESLSPQYDDNYFHPISILMLPSLNYEYKLVSEEADDRIGIPKGLPTDSLPGGTLCSVITTIRGYDLQYSEHCLTEKNCSCSPLGETAGYLPRFMSIEPLECNGSKQRLRLLAEFHKNSNGGYNSWPFNPSSALVGEGWWDNRKNQLFVVACRILGIAETMANAQVGNCSTRLSLSFPSIWSIRHASPIVGQIWSNETVQGNKERLMFQGKKERRYPGIKYEYSQLVKVRNLCPRKQNHNKGETFPDVYSSDMSFDMSVLHSKTNIGWGYSSPLFVGDHFYSSYWFAMPLYNSLAVPLSNSSKITQSNVSYQIGITLRTNSTSRSGNFLSKMYPYSGETLQISAEGIYDTETGCLCMVGCRDLSPQNQIPTNNSVDCEILIKFKFPPLNAKKKSGFIEGSIKSTREKGDPLFFERLDLSSSAYFTAVANRSISREIIEVIVVLISTMLACVFVGLQLYHVKKNPDLLPYISLSLLSILTLGHMIPLLLNFEALFKQNPTGREILIGSSGWLEADKIAARLITMVALMLQFRLLQQTWSARMDDKNQNSIWVAEKLALYVTVPLYAAGFLTVLLENRRKKNHNIVRYYFSPTLSIVWEDLKAYAGLVLDGFLLPQIILNLFSNSRGNALSCWFYFGTAFVRVLPHAYDLYRAHAYSSYDDGSYIYANPSADFYSNVWDIVIPMGGLLFGIVIYLQQRFGGQFILPRKLRGELYEKVPVVAEDEIEMPCS